MSYRIKSKIGFVLSLVLLFSAAWPHMAVPVSAADADAEPVTITIDQDDIVQSDFLGVGVNVIPTSLMPGSTQYGYTDAYWEMDRKRILTVKPKVARVWFQIDWMEKEKGVYNFDTLEMEALYNYLDAFKDAGTEIELNFGWKVGSDVHDWFVIPGVDPWISAPADLDAYAASASALLQELIFERGYDNINYLTFYNEPNGNWDFEAPGDQQAYYAEMVKKTSEQLTRDGIRDLIEIWGPEETGAPLWIKYMKDHVDDYIDGYTFHVYGESYDGLGAAFELRQSYVGDKPIHLTEFGWADDNANSWDAGYAGSVIQTANMGVKSALMWQLNGVWSYDPYGDTSGTYTMWDSLLYGLDARKTFYNVGMLMRYVPEHSEVLKVTTDSPDVRAAAFRGQDGEYTIVLETKEGSDKAVTFDFAGGSIDKTFRKFVYQNDIVPDGQALLPSTAGTYAAGTSFTDGTIDSNYNVIVYTTAAPQTQVEVTPLHPTISADETVTFTASVIDNSGGVTWSVIGEGNGSIDAATGLYTPPDVETEKVIAIKAQSVSDPDGYGIALVKVRPAAKEGRAATPAIGLKHGVYDQSEAVYITSETEGAAIYYTTNGQTPTEESHLYTGAVILEEGKTVLLQAIAIKEGLEPSGVTSALYKVHQNGNGPDGYTFCMYDNGDICRLDQPASVAYGADGLFNYITAADDVACTSAMFGGDPIPGVEKRCYYSYDIPDELPLATIYNAGFERPSTTGTVVGPRTVGWTFNSRAGILHNDSVFNPAPAPEGVQSAYLKTDGGVSGEISQDIYFKPGTYQVEFHAAKRTDFGGTQTFDVYVGDVVVGSYAADQGEFRKFRTDSFTIDATSKHTLRFVATTTEGDNTAFLDAVRIVEPEEPQAPYVANASFEQPAASMEEGHVLEGIESGWIFGTNAGIVRNNNDLQSPNAPYGVQAGFLKAGDEAGSFSQNVYFPEGTYTIGFQAAGPSSGSQTIDLYVGEQWIDSVTLASAGYHSFETKFFTVQEGHYDLRFAARQTDGERVSFIDAVTINEIVIPAMPALANGSFETPEVTASTGVLVGGTSSWSFNNYAGTIRNGSVFETADAPDGVQAGYLQTIDGNRGEFSQSVVFPAGHYEIRFHAARRTSFGGQQTFNVYLDETLLGSYTPTSGNYAAYTTEGFVIEEPSKHVIRFAAATTEGDNTAFVDAISIEPYTAPALVVNNAGFEEPEITTPAGTIYNLESGWLFNTHAGMARNGSVFDQAAAPEGNQVAYMLTNDSGHGEISQLVEFPAGTYKMSLQAARRGYGGQQSFDVAVGERTVLSVTPTDTAFGLYETEPFTVTAGTYEVKFVATTTEGDNTAFVDDVAFHLIEERNDEASIVALTIAGQIGSSAIDADARTVTVTMPAGSDIGSLRPTLVLAEGATVDPASGTAQNFENGPVIYTVTAEDGVTVQQWTVIVIREMPASSEKQIMSFTIEGQIGESDIDPDTRSVTVVVPHGASLGSIAPVIELSPGAVSNPASGEAQNFSDGPVTYTVTAEDGSSAEWTVTVKRAAAPPSPGVFYPAGNNEDVIPVKPEDVRVAAGTAAGIEVIRSTDAQGVVRDRIELTREQAAEASERAKEEGHTAIVVYVPEQPDEVSETLVQIPVDTLQWLAGQGLDMIVLSPYAQMVVAKESLAALQEDLYFRIVPVKDKQTAAELERRAQTDQTLGMDEERQNSLRLIGLPSIVESNVADTKVALILPITDESLPAGESEREQFLRSLYVYIEHRDGDRTLLKPEVVDYNGEGTYGLRFDIAKFSTFSIVAMDEREAEPQYGPYMGGYPDGTFRPESHLTRAQMAAIVARLIDGEQSASLEYSDIADDHWAASYIGKVTDAGLMNGYADGSFRPDQAITRAEMATVAARWLRLEGEGRAVFTDVAGHHAEAAITQVSGAGLMNGYADGSFRPERPITRAETAAVVNRLLGITPEGGAEAPAWPDVPASHWAYPDIRSATAERQ